MKSAPTENVNGDTRIGLFLPATFISWPWRVKTSIRSVRFRRSSFSWTKNWRLCLSRKSLTDGASKEYENSAPPRLMTALTVRPGSLGCISTGVSTVMGPLSRAEFASHSIPRSTLVLPTPFLPTSAVMLFLSGMFVDRHDRKL